MKKFKQIILSFAIIVCVAFASLVFVGCGKSKNSSMSTKNVYSMGMVSAANYLSSTKSHNTVVSEQTKDTIKEYVQMFEGLLKNGLNPVESVPTEADGAYAKYAKKLEISAGGHTYSMYYNEVVEGTETEVDDEEIETETKSFLYGEVVTILNNESVVYNVVGTREIESEKKKDVVETENEMELLFTSDKLDVSSIRNFEKINLKTLENYVLIEQETEKDEIEFEYTTKTGKHIKQVEIELENEKGTVSLEVEIKENNVKTKYDIDKVSENKYSIKVKENKKYKTILYLENNNDVWTYTNAE